MRIICLSNSGNWYGVYDPRRRGPYGTSMVFSGTVEDCIDYKRRNV